MLACIRRFSSKVQRGANRKNHGERRSAIACRSTPLGGGLREQATTAVSASVVMPRETRHRASIQVLIQPIPRGRRWSESQKRHRIQGEGQNVSFHAEAAHDTHRATFRPPLGAKPRMPHTIRPNLPLSPRKLSLLDESRIVGTPHEGLETIRNKALLRPPAVSQRSRVARFPSRSQPTRLTLIPPHPSPLSVSRKTGSETPHQNKTLKSERQTRKKTRTALRYLLTKCYTPYRPPK